MNTTSEVLAKALDAARDVLKQLITIEAALLTFGIAYVQNITKSRGPTDLIHAAVIVLLVSILSGIVSLIFTVGKDINSWWVRGPALFTLISFMAAVACIGFYVINSPIGVGRLGVRVPPSAPRSRAITEPPQMAPGAPYSSEVQQ
jgi:hypothetical protein